MKRVLNDLLARVEWNQKDIATRLYPIINNYSSSGKSITGYKFVEDRFYNETFRSTEAG
jgi:hypothetical protein